MPKFSHVTLSSNWYSTYGGVFIPAASHKGTILDGELVIMKNSVPDFEELKRRTMMSDSFRIRLAGAQHPASYVAFDILYRNGEELVLKSLMERKAILEEAFADSPRLAKTMHVDTRGSAFFELTRRQGLEGIVAKKKDSLYYFGKTTKEWIKLKNWIDEDFAACGYIQKEGSLVSLVLGNIWMVN